MSTSKGRMLSQWFVKAGPRSLNIRMRQIAAEKWQVKKRWFLVSRASVHREHPVCAPLFQEAILSPVVNLFRVASQVKKEYLGVWWVNHIPLYHSTVGFSSLINAQVALELNVGKKYRLCVSIRPHHFHLPSLVGAGRKLPPQSHLRDLIDDVYGYVMPAPVPPLKW